jgi:hypothetical protein
MSLERGPLSLVSTIEELFGWKSGASGLKNRDYDCRGSFVLITWHAISTKIGTNFTDKLRSFGRYSSLADWGHGVTWFMGHSIAVGPSPLRGGRACSWRATRAKCWNNERPVSTQQRARADRSDSTLLGGVANAGCERHVYTSRQLCGNHGDFGRSGEVYKWREDPWKYGVHLLQFRHIL